MVLAICISELKPSCIRAPPLAVMQAKAWPFSTATCAPRTKRSPTTEPIDPPMNSNSKTASTSGTALIVPCTTTSASVSPVSTVAAFNRSGYFFPSVNFRLSTGTTSLPISNRFSGSSNRSIRVRALIRW